MSSPRPWGCFASLCARPSDWSVFPTPVGVFPTAPACQRSGRCLPHARGGVSCPRRCSRSGCPSSPRPWGCFCPARPGGASGNVFPTPVGVFLSAAPPKKAVTCLPHARGGVSDCYRDQDLEQESSPRPWGCFSYQELDSRYQAVFPTPVGVFLSRIIGPIGVRRLPHARGGVSTRPEPASPIWRSSPRPWGCFHAVAGLWRRERVFPTPVGVFPLTRFIAWLIIGLPHARGGVSV